MNKEEFSALLDKYLSGNATPEEEKLLNSVYEQFGEKHPLNINELQALNETEDRLLHRIQARINPAPAQQPVRRLPAIAKYAAAACLLCFIAIALKLFVFKPTGQVASNRISATNDIRPGTNKAYLVLASGKTIMLNNTGAGVLAVQGANTITQQNGQVIYQAGATTTAVADNQYNKIVVPRGGQYKVILPDGTAVWLNSSSSLAYPVQFSGGRRSIKLTGEAYFEVAKNKQLPFVVNVNDRMDVRVLGTHFNIMGYDTENHITTTLLEGSVKIEDRTDATNTAMLSPGQEADMAADRKIAVNGTEDDDAIAWKNGQFIFNNESIYSITRKLSRWYDVDFVLDPKIKNISFDGTISRSKNISEVLELMTRTNSVHFNIKGRRVMVMP